MGKFSRRGAFAKNTITDSAPQIQAININITIKFKELECVSFLLSDYGQRNATPIYSDSFEFQFTLQHSFNIFDKTAILFFDSILFEKTAQFKNELAQLKTRMVFTILNFNEITSQKDGHLSVPDSVLTLTAGLAASTVRGMFAVKLENTIYKNAILPIIDPAMFLPHRINLLA